MKTIGDALLELMIEMELLEPETKEIAKKISNLDSSALLQVDSIIKLGKLNSASGKKK